MEDEGRSAELGRLEAELTRVRAELAQLQGFRSRVERLLAVLVRCGSRRQDERPEADPNPEGELERLRAEQGRERLLEDFFYALLDWIVEGKEPELDPARQQEAADRGLGAMVRWYREAMDRQGLAAAEVDRRMRWPAGRTERVLARPEELRHGEEMRLADLLGFRVDQCFEETTKKGETDAGGKDEAGRPG